MRVLLFIIMVLVFLSSCGGSSSIRKHNVEINLDQTGVTSEKILKTKSFSYHGSKVMIIEDTRPVYVSRGNNFYNKVGRNNYEKLEVAIFKKITAKSKFSCVSFLLNSYSSPIKEENEIVVSLHRNSCKKSPMSSKKRTIREHISSNNIVNYSYDLFTEMIK